MLDQIQKFVMSYFEQPTDLDSLRRVTYHSNIIEQLTTIDGEKKETEQVPQLFKKIFSEVEYETVISTSGKAIVIVTEEQKQKIERNIRKIYLKFVELNLQLKYGVQQMASDELDIKEYDELMRKISNSAENNLYRILDNQTEKNFWFNQPTSKEKDCIQSTGVLLEKYVSDYKEENPNSAINQIAIVKADINNLGSYFKNSRTIEILKSSSQKIHALLNKISEIENPLIPKYFTLYAAGDDVFMIGSITEIECMIKAIIDMTEEMNDELKPETAFTVGIGVLTTDYRSTIRYYMERVEVLMERAKGEAKRKKRSIVNINGQLLNLEEATNKDIRYETNMDFYDFWKLSQYFARNIESKITSKNGSIQKNNGISISKVHQALDIIKETILIIENDKNGLEKKLLESMYILTKDINQKLAQRKQNALNLQLALEICNHLTSDEYITKYELTKLSSLFKNILLFVRYLKNDKNFDINSIEGMDGCTRMIERNIGKIQEKYADLQLVKFFESRKKQWDGFINKHKETIQQNFPNVKDINSIPNRGFWFTLEKIQEHELQLFLKNYQCENKVLFASYAPSMNEEKRQIRLQIETSEDDMPLVNPTFIENMRKEWLSPQKKDDYHALIRIQLISLNLAKAGK